MSRLLNIARNLWNKPGYTLMRGGARFAFVRESVANVRSALDSRKKARYLLECESRMSETQFPDIDRKRFVQELRENGIAFGLTLPEAMVVSIRQYAENNVCYADRKEKHGYRLSQTKLAEAALNKPIMLAQYFNTAETCPDIVRLANDPMLQAIACEYMECVPAFVGTNLWWTFPVKALEEDREYHAHLHHRDVDDFRFFKFFFYLTDIREGDGAHVCVVGSHVRPPEIRFGDKWNIRRYTDEEVNSSYPSDAIKEICAPAGTGFAENTLCIHKGTTPTKTPRLLLQLQYALFDYGVTDDQRNANSLKQIA